MNDSNGREAIIVVTSELPEKGTLLVWEGNFKVNAGSVKVQSGLMLAGRHYVVIPMLKGWEKEMGNVRFANAFEGGDYFNIFYGEGGSVHKVSVKVPGDKYNKAEPVYVEQNGILYILQADTRTVYVYNVQNYEPTLIGNISINEIYPNLNFNPYVSSIYYLIAPIGLEKKLDGVTMLGLFQRYYKVLVSANYNPFIASYPDGKALDIVLSVGDTKGNGVRLYISYFYTIPASKNVIYQFSVVSNGLSTLFVTTNLDIQNS